jgi:NarL family two-component system response regulator LiaR
MDGLQATRQIKSKYPDMKILILTQHDSPEYIRPLLEAGAAGYVLKRSGGREVVAAIRNVWEQGAFLQPDVARQFLKDYSHTGDQPPTEEIHFTEREQEILKLAVEGKSNKEIATLLCISPKTVSVHRSNIMSKLGVRSGVELVRYAMQHKLVKVGPHKLDNTN